MLYGYVRVSTAGQAKDGNSLEAQTARLKAAGVKVGNIYADTISGGKDSRPQLDELVEKLGKGDTLIVVKLDRLMRSLSKGIELINELIGRGVALKSLDDNISFDNNPMNKAMRQMILVFAELEKELIKQRTQEGKAIAKAKPGFKEGRPPEYTPEQLRHAVELLESHSYKEVEAMTKISKSTLQRAKRKAGGADGDGNSTIQQSISASEPEPPPLPSNARKRGERKKR